MLFKKCFKSKVFSLNHCQYESTYQGVLPQSRGPPTEAAELSLNRQEAKLKGKLNLLFLGLFISPEGCEIPLLNWKGP